MDGDAAQFGCARSAAWLSRPLEENVSELVSLERSLHKTPRINASPPTLILSYRALQLDGLMSACIPAEGGQCTGLLRGGKLHVEVRTAHRFWHIRIVSENSFSVDLWSWAGFQESREVRSHAAIQCVSRLTLPQYPARGHAPLKNPLCKNAY
jgi:hypothetical protein